MRDVTVATTQMACEWDRDRNVARAEALVRQAAARGASIVLLQELFESPYFPKDQSARYFALAQPIEGHPLVLIHNGKLYQAMMDQARLTHHELNSALRQAGCGCVDDVHYAVLENNGAISVVARKD